jgi:hypothetical protein
LAVLLAVLGLQASNRMISPALCGPLVMSRCIIDRSTR